MFLLEFKQPRCVRSLQTLIWKFLAAHISGLTAFLRTLNLSSTPFLRSIFKLVQALATMARLLTFCSMSGDLYKFLGVLGYSC